MDRSMVEVRNARTHNLKGLDLDIPKHVIVVFTGVSGSGKSSLVFDTIYTESQRQLIENFSSFARARLPKLSKPPVDEIRNISTAIVIDQKRMGTTLRSTVGTATEISTYLRMLFSRCGDPFIGPSFLFGFNHPQGMCPDCHGIGEQVTADIDLLIDKERSIREGAIDHPDYKVEGWHWREFMAMNLFDVDKKIKDFSEKELDDFLYAKAIPVVKSHGAGTYLKNFEGIIRKLERIYVGKAKNELSGGRKNAYEKYFTYSHCGSCGGSRLNEQARSVKINGKNIAELSSMELSDLDAFLSDVKGDLANPIVKKMRQVLSNMIDIGVGYLSLDRPVATLSGGESQRVKMARQLDCDLVDMMYVLDEPSIGLHPRDISKLIGMLNQLKWKGNSVFVVEHDPAIMECADHLIDIGPVAGSGGGEVVFTGTFSDLKRSDGLTADFLNRIWGGNGKRREWSGSILIENASLHNLKDVSTRIPKGVFTCVTGVAGSGKSSLINDVFVHRNENTIVVDQSPVGRNSRSNPATYIGVFDEIRKEFASANASTPALFSFNSKGACPKCKGLGTIAIEMNFLDDVKIICDECDGKRYRDEILEMKFEGRSIYDILNMTVKESRTLFKDPKIERKLKLLSDVGLGYLEIGQPLSTLSGGECQRIKLASELHKKGNIYVMDEPTTGLHMADIDKLLRIIDDLVENGNTVIVIEHNLDVIRKADWIIDMGPEGGKNGGEIIFEGTPEDLIKCQRSHTGKYLKDVL